MLISLSLDHRNTDIGTRERFHLPDASVERLHTGGRQGAIREIAMLATCNRIELYGWTADSEDPSVGALWDRLALHWQTGRATRDELLDTAHRRTGAAAARHLMRVTAGLESQVLGDGQILGQVRKAYKRASTCGAMGPGLHRLFSAALRVGRRVRKETTLASARNTIGSEAVNLADRRIGPLARKRCVVIGCGKTGEQAARRLSKLGAADIVLVNRSPGRARKLAEEVWGRAAPFRDLHRELARADLAIVATAAPTPTVRTRDLAAAWRSAGRTERPLLLIDVAMPRNAEPGIGQLPGVTLADLDALHVPIADAEETRRAQIPTAIAIVEEELSTFVSWVSAQTARDAIQPLRAVLGHVARREVAFAAGDEIAERTADRIVAKLLAHPMAVLKTASSRGESVDELAHALQMLFSPPESNDGAVSGGPRCY